MVETETGVSDMLGRTDRERPQRCLDIPPPQFERAGRPPGDDDDGALIVKRKRVE